MPDPGASPEPLSDAMVQLVYDDLRQLARRLVARECERHTPRPTALVHDAYLRLVRSPGGCWASRRAFYLAAAQAMRRILIERARRRTRIRHGGAWRRAGADVDDIPRSDTLEMRVAIDRAIDELEKTEPRKAEVVRLRYYLDLRVDEVAEMLEVSATSVKLDWSYAKAWLRRHVERTFIDPI